MFSLTGLVWLVSSGITAFTAYKMLNSPQQKDNTILEKYGRFFAVLSLSFFCFGLSFFTDSGDALKYLSLYVGHAVLWFSLLIIANIPQKLMWEKLPFWLIPSVFLVGGVVHFSLLTRSSLPYVVDLGYYSVVQWNVDTLNFLVFIFSISIITIPNALTLIREAVNLSVNIKVRSYGFGFMFVVGTVAGAASIWSILPVFMLVIANTLSLVAFTTALITVVFYPIEAQEQ